MRVLAITLFALVAVASSKNIKGLFELEDLTAYDYHNKIGIPLANDIREEEAREAVESRIAGGSHASLGQFPYQAALIADLSGGQQSICGGVIVNNRRVLTAAHCWFDGVNQAVRLTVVAGSVSLFTGGQRIQSNNVVMHGSWNPRLIINDIAIIRLNSAFTFNNNVGAVALPTGFETFLDYVGWTATASGFGRTGDGSAHDLTTSQRLSFVNLPVVDTITCAWLYGELEESHLCTATSGGRSTCRGDSGGPLVVTNNGRRILIGLTSFGASAGCTLDYPVVFTRVTSYISWINNRL